MQVQYQIPQPASQFISVSNQRYYLLAPAGLVVLTVKNSFTYRSLPSAASGGHAVYVAQRSECSSM